MKPGFASFVAQEVLERESMWGSCCFVGKAKCCQFGAEEMRKERVSQDMRS
jgi:hypothetical protein